MLLPTGKLPPDLLSRLLHAYAQAGDRVIVGPSVGEDAAVIDFGETCLVAKTDPITFATGEIGHYAVTINANDIAAMGAMPKWLLATVLLPGGGTDEALVESIFRSIHRAASDLGIAVCGGHTEVTHGIDRPIVVGQMLGEVRREDLVRSSGLRPGDAILLTKGMGIEATAIIAREQGERVKGRYGEDFWRRCRDYLRDPGLSVLREARIACETARVHAMHDPTEGGVATGLHELATASGAGLEVVADRLFMSENSRALCEAFGLDPLGVISSGALLIGVAEEDAGRVTEAIRQAGIRCERIGTVREKAFGVKLRRGEQVEDLPVFQRDEITKIFES
ncbi:MAG: hydrogenase expression/formation protein [Candidatus Latescibacteria bacterium]|nr:hydrogenase expression/formation protein [Candidatus Latescibacterota bacterium]